jgi:hypothetical protein
MVDVTSRLHSLTLIPDRAGLPAFLQAGPHIPGYSVTAPSLKGCVVAHARWFRRRGKLYLLFWWPSGVGFGTGRIFDNPAKTS